MNLVLLSGGSGQRLWPLSNDIRSKQFIKIFHREDGELESMVQRVYRQIKAVDTDATVTIATSKSQVSAIHNQLGEEVGISVEPCRRDTFPAIALAAAYLKDVQGVGEEESVVVCPVDPYVENDYFEALKALGDRAAVSSANLVLMGIEPTYPSEKYGYIIPIGKEQVSKVSMFKEKPTQEMAKDYIAKGALWNGGVFAFKLGYVLNRAHELIDFVDYEDLFNKYDTLNKISFDYAVVEHEPEIEVMRFAGTWKDLGTWNTLTEAMDSHAVGEALFNENCENVHVVNELDVPILCMGLKDVVVSASPEGILVSDKEQSSYIKPYVNTLDHRVMFAEKSWGSFKVIALLGWAPKDTNEEFFSMDDLIRIFDENGINKSPSIFDTNKLTWFNAEYIRRMTPEAYAELAKPWLSQVLDPQKFDLDRLCQLLQARTEIFSQLPGMVDFLAEMPELDMALFTNKKSKSTPETSKTALEFVHPILGGIADWTEASLHDTVMAAIPESGMKNATVLWPLRIAITGRAATPGGAFEMAYLLGKDETMKRLDDAMAKL